VKNTQEEVNTMYKALMVAGLGVGILATGFGVGRVLDGVRPATQMALAAHSAAPRAPSASVAGPTLSERLRAATNVEAATRLSYAANKDNKAGEAADNQVTLSASDITLDLSPEVLTKYLSEAPDHRLEELTVDPMTMLGQKFCYSGKLYDVQKTYRGTYRGAFEMYARNGYYVWIRTREPILDGQYRRMCGVFTGVYQATMLDGTKRRLVTIGAATAVTK
jgi:hypothetical protein